MLVALDILEERVVILHSGQEPRRSPQVGTELENGLDPFDGLSHLRIHRPGKPNPRE